MSDRLSPARDGTGQRLAERRMSLSLTQSELAERMGTHQVTISIQERDGVKTLSMIQRLSRALSCNPVWLAYGTGTPELQDEEDH